MKDAYSFDKDQEGLDVSYNKMKEAYIKIFNRCGIVAKPVEADSGAIGGSGSAEFMVKSEVGEDDVVFCTKCDYAANIEKAPSTVEKAEAEDMKELSKVETPNARTIEDLVKFFNTDEKKFAKTLLFNADGKVVAVMIRGDREANEVKISNALGGVVNLNMASAEEVLAATNAQVGFAGPIGLKVDTLLVDEEVTYMNNFVVGANETGYHYDNVNYNRDFTGVVGDFRNITEGELCPKCSEKITISRGTEVGHIFKLGTKYSEAMNANFIDENGKEKPFIMGCYGIGVTRTMASVIEQNNDENGIVWPLAIAPYQVNVIPVNIKDETQMKVATEIYEALRKTGARVVLDDRNERAGVKFKDSDLMGTPMRITVGKKVTEGEVEFKLRTSDVVNVKIEEVVEKVREEFNNKNIFIR